MMCLRVGEQETREEAEREWMGVYRSGRPGAAPIYQRRLIANTEFAFASTADWLPRPSAGLGIGISNRGNSSGLRRIDTSALLCAQLKPFSCHFGISLSFAWAGEPAVNFGHCQFTRFSLQTAQSGQPTSLPLPPWLRRWLHPERSARQGHSRVVITATIQRRRCLFP